MPEQLSSGSLLLEVQQSQYLEGKPIYIYIYLKYSLIIHEEKTKEISGMTVVVYLIQNSADLHKL